LKEGGCKMNLKKNRYIVILLVIAILSSIFNVEYFNFNNNVIEHRENNFDKYYNVQEIINIIEDVNEKQYNNMQSFRFKNKVISNSFDKYIGINISTANNIYKLKYTDVLNKIFYIFNDCVFVVLYIHKKDGKKHHLLAI
jgi:hypothetical protein